MYNLVEMPDFVWQLFSFVIGLFSTWYFPKFYAYFKAKQYFEERGYTEEMIKFIMKAF